MLSCCACKQLNLAHNNIKCDLFSRITICVTTCIQIIGIYALSVHDGLDDATADSGINDQLIKLHSTHSWIRRVLSLSVSYFRRKT